MSKSIIVNDPLEEEYSTATRKRQKMATQLSKQMDEKEDCDTDDEKQDEDDDDDDEEEVDDEDDDDDEEEKDGENSKNVLHDAVEHGKLEELQKLLFEIKNLHLSPAELNLQLNQLNQVGETVLMMAVEHCHTNNAFVLAQNLKFVQALLEAGVDVSFKTPDHTTALMTAAESNCPEAAQLLIQYQLPGQNIVQDINDLKQTPFLLACMYGSLDTAKMLWRYDPAVAEATDKDQSNGLMLAARNGRIHREAHKSPKADCCLTCFLMIDVQIPLNNRNTAGLSAIQQALINDHKLVVSFLLDQPGCNLDGVALNLAQQLPNWHSTLNWFLDNPKCNFNESIKKDTPLMWAVRSNYTMAAVSIARAGMVRDPNYVNLQDAKGRTALSWAVSCAQEHIIRILITELRADPNIADFQNKLPRDYIIFKKRNTASIQALLS
jgi:ankyrin repeat protein